MLHSSHASDATPGTGSKPAPHTLRIALLTKDVTVYEDTVEVDTAAAQTPYNIPLSEEIFEKVPNGGVLSLVISTPPSKPHYGRYRSFVPAPEEAADSLN